ncbi:FUSC family membrane protein [Kitasatospora fiedleri]|uniref:FUSC family membrane protein n=1 Tax=Kitasatospora fiedleri TaxID=2991545 RepID=UPI00249B05F3|nr:FUSC family membrane protein [Kitasatospora fiedleri]
MNDRPAGRRTGAVQQAVPAFAGALGLLVGVAGGWWAVPLLGAVGVLCGAISVAGPVASAAAVQLMVLTVLGCGLPVPLPGWARAGCYLAGAAWLLLLRQLTSHPRPLHAERQAVAAVFDALAEALDAAGTDRAESARRRLTAALDRAGEQLRTGHDHALRTRLAAASALCEASVALLRAARPLPARLATGPRRLATAVRTDRLPGRCRPRRRDPGHRRLRPRRPARGPRLRRDAGTGRARRRPRPDARRGLRGRWPRWCWARRGEWRGPVPGVRPWGRAGRAYGCGSGCASRRGTALALALRTGHWYWLPVTAAFLVKPDLGRCSPGSSTASPDGRRRAAGRAARPGAVRPVVAGRRGGRHRRADTRGPAALRRADRRHHRTVLAFTTTGGDHGAAPARLADTALACALVLLVGHLPGLTDTRARVGQRAAHALRTPSATSTTSCWPVRRTGTASGPRPPTGPNCAAPPTAPSPRPAPPPRPPPPNSAPADRPGRTGCA